MLRIFFAISLLFCPLSLFSLTLSNKLSQAEKGDYIVTLIHKTYTLINVYEKTDKTIVFEEVSIPYGSVGRAPDWHEVMANRAPGATSWILYQLDLEDGKMIECYSVTKGSFLDLSSFDSILAKLMVLPLSPVPDRERRRIGASSSLGAFDTRKIWNPPQMFNQKKVNKPEYHVFKATWPSDETLLSGKTVELYFDAGKAQFPFPFWMQVKDASDTSFKLPTVAAGNHLVSPIPEMPHRLPHFYDGVSVQKNKVVLKVSIPKYYEGLKLYFVTYVPIAEAPILAEAEIVQGDDPECVEFHIPNSFIEQHLGMMKAYHFQLKSDSHPKMQVESSKSVRFKNLSK